MKKEICATSCPNVFLTSPLFSKFLHLGIFQNIDNKKNKINNLLKNESLVHSNFE